MAEEEHQDLADFRRHVDLGMRRRIAVEFLRHESLKAPAGVAPEDKDPDGYVRHVEESAGS